MKTKLSVLLCFAFFCSFAQDKQTQEVTTEVESVTVFINGAQITRTKQVQIPAGVSELKFVKLSPYVDASTIQVKVDGDVRVSSVNFQKNYLDKQQKTAEAETLVKQLEELNGNLEVENANYEILNEQISFLKENKHITGTSQAVSVIALREASEFYDSKIQALLTKKLQLERKITNLNGQLEDIEKQLRVIQGTKLDASGEILVEIDAPAVKSANVSISYIVKGAGWYPTYDIRVSGIDKPMEIIYKANVWQNTKVEWNNVKLVMSSNEPNVSAVMPKLKTYYLGYGVKPPRYNVTNARGDTQLSVTSVSGYVTDEDGLPFPGVNVVVDGTTIGTVTNGDGYYSLTLPANAKTIVFSMVGYISEYQSVTSSNINVKLFPDLVGLEEVVVVGYGSGRKRPFSRISEMFHSDDKNEVVYDDVELEPELTASARQTSKSINASAVEQTENQTSVNFEISKPYTIKSDNKVTVVDMVQYDIPVEYKYYSIPKIEEKAYLTANIIKWESYGFIEGEASISLDGTFLGKSVLSLKSATDTLTLSLGQDKSISVSRTLAKDLTKRSFIGSKCEVTRDWKISVKNNRTQKIDITILDQVPVSKYQEIEVVADKLLTGNRNDDDGTVEWKLIMDPNETKELELNYLVRYPKNKNVIVE